MLNWWGGPKIKSQLIKPLNLMVNVNWIDFNTEHYFLILVYWVTQQKL